MRELPPPPRKKFNLKNELLLYSIVVREAFEDVYINDYMYYLFYQHLKQYANVSINSLSYQICD